MRLSAPADAVDRAAMTHVRRDGTSVSCHKQSSHDATFGNAASLADNNGFGSRSYSSRSSNAALRNTDRLAIDDGIGRPGTHGGSNKQREPKHDKPMTRNMIIPPPQAEPLVRL